MKGGHGCKGGYSIGDLPTIENRSLAPACLRGALAPIQMIL